MNRRVLLIVPSITSVRTFLASLPTRAAEAGVEIYLAAGPPLAGAAHGLQDEPLAGFLELPGVRSGDPFAAARAVLRLRRFLATVRPHVIHAHFAAAATIAAATRALAPSVPAAWWATFHGLHTGVSGTGRWARTAGWELWAARRHDRVFVLNAEDADFLHRRVPTLDVRVTSVLLGCDLERFSPHRFPPADRLQIRDSLGIPAHAPVVVFVGRQTAFKGFGTLLRAFWKVRESIPDCRLVLVGSRDPVHAVGLEPAELRRMTADPMVIDCGWQDDVSPFLAIADACLFPSEREGMPVCLMEALSMGVPCVTSDSRGCRDVVRHEVDGLLLQAASPAAYADAACRILRSAPLREEMRRHALEGRQRFDRRAFITDQVRLYRDAPVGAPHT
jgi:glycosyltransferase involved in cell wall biosynthesis